MIKTSAAHLSGLELQSPRVPPRASRPGILMGKLFAAMGFLLLAGAIALPVKHRTTRRPTTESCRGTDRAQQQQQQCSQHPLALPSIDGSRRWQPQLVRLPWANLPPHAHHPPTPPTRTKLHEPPTWKARFCIWQGGEEGLSRMRRLAVGLLAIGQGGASSSVDSVEEEPVAVSLIGSTA
jgi:hypothetical protein